MKPDESPFLLARVECPICKTVNEYETIRLGAYSETGRDTDFCPSGRQWRNPRYQHVNPLLYFMATCSSCFYTREFNPKFREWKDDQAFRSDVLKNVRQRHLSALANPDGPLRRLAGALWPSSYPLETAINKLLLGILDEELLAQPSALDLARWYLRIAWLFREHAGLDLDAPSSRILTRRCLQRSLRDLAGDVTRVGQRLDEIHHLIDAHPESAATVPEDNEGPTQCLRTIADLTERVTHVAAGVDGLTCNLADDEGPVVGGSLPAGESYGDYPSYAAFLRALQLDWPAVPVNEQEALTYALQHYGRAHDSGSGIEPGNARIQVAYLMGELARRIGQLDEAERHLNTAIRLGREWIQHLGDDKTQTALARHIVDLAVAQMRGLHATVPTGAGR